MHILVVALHRPDNPTGVCRHAANLAKCLAQTDEVTHITLVTGVWQQHYFRTAFQLDSAKIQILAIDINNTSIARNLWFLFALPKLAKQLQPDLVHLTFPLPLIRSQFNCPIVTTIHDLYPYKYPENFGRKQAFFNRLFLRQSIRNSDALACVSQTTLADLEYYFPIVGSSNKKTKVIYNFVDFDRVDIKPLQALKDRDTVPFLLCVGQHRKNKNIDLLIRSYAALLQEQKIDSQMMLIVVGTSGPETEHLIQSIQEHSLTNSVLLLSAIDDRELCWLYQNCQMLVIPSTVEGFCIPLVEALYFSARVICSDIPIFREIGLNNCIYFDIAEDPIANIARSIERTLQIAPPKDNDCCLRFSKQEIANLYLNFYSELI
jgi:glycosyltransferase involved in cell wall biosynthesis